MEMVLELPYNLRYISQTLSFNPSSNGNGAGIARSLFIFNHTLSFNPSSNGNGAGIRKALESRKPAEMFQSFF